MFSTKFELCVGRGYFSGALLTVTATPTVSGARGWDWMQDCTLEEGVDRFLNLVMPEKPT